jgi:hypothetical protein
MSLGIYIAIGIDLYVMMNVYQKDKHGMESKHSRPLKLEKGNV